MKQPAVLTIAKSISKSASQLMISSPLEETKPVCVYDHVEGYVLLLESRDESFKFTPRELGKLLKPGKKNDKRQVAREYLYYAKLDGQNASLSLKPHVSAKDGDYLILDVSDFAIDLVVPSPEIKKFSRLFPLQLTHKSTKKTYFLQFSTGIAKEQWYIALKKASTLLRSAQLPPLDFDFQISPFNALVIRIWNSISTTQKFHQSVRDRITKRLDAIKKPGFIGDLKLKSIKIGSEPPLFYNLALENTREALVIGGHVVYKGAFEVVIETTVKLDVTGQRLELLLSVVVEELAGKVVFQINQLPSNRVWWAFKEPPKLELKITPLLGSQNIGFNMVSDLIEKKLKTSLEDSLVLPNMQDYELYGDFSGDVWAHYLMSSQASRRGSEEPLVPSPTNNRRLSENSLMGLQALLSPDATPLSQRGRRISQISSPQINFTPRVRLANQEVALEKNPLMSPIVSMKMAMEEAAQRFIPTQSPGASPNARRFLFKTAPADQGK